MIWSRAEADLYTVEFLRARQRSRRPLMEVTKFEPVATAPHVRLTELGYAAYPYDTFLLIRLPEGRFFVYRVQSDNHLVAEGTTPYDARPAEYLWPLIDEACRDKLTRVPAAARATVPPPF